MHLLDRQDWYHLTILFQTCCPLLTSNWKRAQVHSSKTRLLKHVQKKHPYPGDRILMLLISARKQNKIRKAGQFSNPTINPSFQEECMSHIWNIERNTGRTWGSHKLLWVCAFYHQSWFLPSSFRFSSSSCFCFYSFGTSFLCPSSLFPFLPLYLQFGYHYSPLHSTSLPLSYS